MSTSGKSISKNKWCQSNRKKEEMLIQSVTDSLLVNREACNRAISSAGGSSQDLSVKTETNKLLKV